MITNEFKKEYAKLNPKQKEAVDTIEGPVMVVAGPGTGKTTILTLRIANILKETDTPPSGILALTFTEAGAKTMKNKLLIIQHQSITYSNHSTYSINKQNIIQQFFLH
jgi:DNA helicase-2/ATP-dependent DNA helicase PcrA